MVHVPWDSTINIDDILLASRNVCSQVPNLTCWSNDLSNSIVLSTSIKTPQAFSPKPEKLNIAGLIIA